MINAQLGEQGFEDDYLDEPAKGRPRNLSAIGRRANLLVNVSIGDPAIRPFGAIHRFIRVVGN